MLKNLPFSQTDQISSSVNNELNVYLGTEIAPRIFLLNWNIPEFSRQKICDYLKSVSVHKDFYLIVTISWEKSPEIFEILKSGADDCLFFPYTEEELAARLLIAEKRLEAQDKIALSKNEGLCIESLRDEETLSLIHDPIIIFDTLTNTVLEVNYKACETYAITRDDFIGMPVKHIWVNSTHDFEMFGHLFSDGYSRNFETTHLRSDGLQMKMIVNSSLIHFRNQQAILSVNNNVTGYQEAEIGIRVANIEWRNTVDAVSDMIILEDTDGKIKRCNKATADFFNKPYEKLIRQPIKSLFAFTSDSEINSGEDLNDFAGINLKEKTRIEQLDEKGNWFEINSHQVKSELKSGNQWVHVIKDITKRKEFEQELQRLYTVVEQAANSILITDLNGQIQYVNSKFVEIMQEDKENLLYQSIFQIPPFHAHQEILTTIHSNLLKNQAWQQIFPVNRRNNEVFEEISASLITDKNGVPINFVFIIRDVTETRQLESIAEAVNMMENVGYIFSGIRHELGNPINSVKTALTVMQKNLDKWTFDQVGLYIERCLSEISRIEFLLRSLKTFSMYENPRIEAVEINQYMEKFVELVREDFSNLGIRIYFSTKVKNTISLCDPRVLHQVMLNLLANAAGALENRLDPQILISISRTKKRLNITIEDNGIGMSEKQLNNLFKPFYTSKPGGTGLGLVIVRKMLAKMNGTINFESKEGFGTKVKFTLETTET